jgi:hypothetical protein
MSITSQLAKHLREVYVGGNWTYSNFKDNLKDVTWQQATTSVYSFNTIATLVYHTNYYVQAVTRVLRKEPINAKDENSFETPPILSQEDWETFLEKTWTDAETLASLVEQLPENRLWEDFSENKYGNYYRNISGVIEHNHYHLGQIALIKKILLQEGKN